MSRIHQPDQGTFHAIHPEDVRWQPFASFPPAARFAILIGDPAKPGPYLIRVRLPAGTKMMPHKHPEDRIYTVLAGVFYIGLGETFDESKLTAYGVGSLIVLPGGQPHFHWAKSGEYITQVTAMGPLGLSYIHPRDDPRNPKFLAGTGQTHRRSSHPRAARALKSRQDPRFLSAGSPKTDRSLRNR